MSEPELTINSDPPQQIWKRPGSVSRICAAAGIAIGTLALAGWVFGVRTLMQVFPGLVAIAPNAAVGLALTGFALWLQAGTPSRKSLRASRVAAAAAGLLGLLTFGEYLLGFDLGLDTFLFRDTEGLTGPFPGRMALAASLSFTLAGAALALTSLSRSRALAESLAAIVFLTALVSLEGYAYGVRSLYAIGFYKGIALHAALGLLVLSIGILLMRHDFWLPRLIASETAGSVVARWSLPIALGIPLLLGWLRLAGEQAGLYGPEFGRALLSVATTVFLMAALLGIATALKRVAEQRREGDDSLRRAERYARSLLEASLDPLVTISPGGKITDVNEATIRVTGVSRETLVGTDFSDYFTEPEKAREGYREVFARGFVTDYPLTIRREDGRLTDVLYNAATYGDDSGTVQGVFAAARDVTDRKRAEEEVHRLNAELEQRVADRTADLEAVNREMEAFSYSVSHDLRAPLRSIDGFSRVLEEDYGDRLDAEGHKMTARIVAAARSMGQLIDDLLKLSRVTRAEVRREVVDLSGMAGELAAGLAQREPDRKIDVLIEEGAIVEGDTQLLRLAMQNLLGNAFKFTSKKAGARIEFGRDRDGKEPVYYVRDNGAGFDQAYVGKLFGAFQRLHAERDFPGTGIGLATVQRILRRHGGRIWAEGQTDQGATFYFTLGKDRS